MKHDQTYHTDLLQTLRAYIFSGRNAAAASEQLHIHKSTFFYRMNKIAELLGTDIYDRKRLFAYEFTFYLIDYLKQTQITSEYAEAHFDELKIRNISYLLVKFEDGDSGKGTPTEDEQKRMDAVDAAFAEGKTFAEVAQAYSEDPSTAENGGVLGTVDVNTTSLDQDFLNGALALAEGEISDWIYSPNFGYFKVQNNASTPEKLLALYREQNAIPEETEITASEVYASLLGDYDTSLANRAIYEKAQELGMTFANSDDEAKLKQFLGIEE
jgi:foldase protein PrsA